MPCRSLKIAFFSQHHINQLVIEVSALGNEFIQSKFLFRCNKQLLQMEVDCIHVVQVHGWASGAGVQVVGK